MPVEGFSLDFQYYAEYMYDYDAYLAALPAGFPADKRWNHTFTFRATRLLKQQTLRLSLYALYDTSNSDHFINPELRYSFTDRFSAALGANFFGGKLWGQYGQLSRDGNIYLRSKFEF